MSSQRLDNDFPYDPLYDMQDYFQHVFGDSYTINKDSGGVEIPDDVYGNAYDYPTTISWWEDADYTNSDKNLLVVREQNYGQYGVTNKLEGKAAIVSVQDNLANIPSEDDDPDMIGRNPQAGYGANMQMSAAFHEVGHMYGCDDPRPIEGYCDNHNFVNYLTPMATSYAKNNDGYENLCGDVIDHNYSNESRHVEGYLQCGVDNASFPETPKEVYTASEVNSL